MAIIPYGFSQGIPPGKASKTRAKAAPHLAAANLSTINRTAQDRAAASTQQGAERVSANRIAKQAAANRADHETGAAIVATAVIAPVMAPIELVVAPHAPLMMPAARPIAIGRIPLAVLGTTPPLMIVPALSRSSAGHHRNSKAERRYRQGTQFLFHCSVLHSDCGGTLSFKKHGQQHRNLRSLALPRTSSPAPHRTRKTAHAENHILRRAHPLSGIVWEHCARSRNYRAIRARNGGDGEIRTLGTDVSVRRFSKPLVSATHPRLRRVATRRAIARGWRSGKGDMRPFCAVVH